ncbi:MAG TPA: PHP domain-containing protein [Candidatus Dormibacteraeota bacterium]|nr:PHP domain-containing protein [Candidatus Dormibacteraeota bacterium]
MPDAAGAQRIVLPPGLSAAEVHAHTLASDGMVTASDLVRAAAAIGLSAVCVTDHDTIPDLAEATDVGAALGVDVVRGEEVTCVFPPGTHIVGLFIERQIRMHMSVADTVDAIHDHGGLALVAHPFMPTYFASMSQGRLDHLLRSRRVDGIELRHTAPVLPGTWKRLDEYYAAHRDQLGAAVGAGDSHFGAADVGRVVTVFDGRGARGLRAALEARTTSPLAGITPVPPGWRARLGQQQRAMLWLSHQRRTGRVGSGAGPSRERHGSRA